MMHPSTQLLAALVAAACALPGVFLVLRRMALISDAISHVVLLGIVVSFLLIRDLKSPWLFLGAAASGVLAVALVELTQRTGLVREDAAIGLVFPAMFSLAVLLVAQKTANIHLDADAVLLGHIGLAGLEGWGATWRMLGVLLLNAGFIAIFYKELKLATFDAALATAMGFMPALLHYALMGLVSLTAVAAFDAVGSVLVVALMIVPAATAYLLTDKLSSMIGISLGLAMTAALSGYWLAHFAAQGNWELEISATMVVVLGVEFALAFVFAPHRGQWALYRQRLRRQAAFLRTSLAIHLLNHEGTAAEAVENRLQALPDHLRWPAETVNRVVRRAADEGLLEIRHGMLYLTDTGRRLAQRAFDGSLVER